MIFYFSETYLLAYIFIVTLVKIIVGRFLLTPEDMLEPVINSIYTVIIADVINEKAW